MKKKSSTVVQKCKVQTLESSKSGKNSVTGLENPHSTECIKLSKLGVVQN